ncbi:hypothetical protein [Halobellus ordinarius]|uniref:hypothetical protein n=1 Tax=Halobellus ordinarius TaxID=3075120 RepID=UPI0028808949|nr:hypothetical protein [Halobellus sp. ZY16]
MSTTSLSIPKGTVDDRPKASAYEPGQEFLVITDSGYRLTKVNDAGDQWIPANMDLDGADIKNAGSLTTGKQSLTGLALAVYRDPDSGDWTEEAFTSIQDAIDAIPAGGGIKKDAGKVIIGSKGGDGQDATWFESITINKRIIVEGVGISTKLQASSGSDPVVEISDCDDAILRNLWVNHKGSGPAIAQTSPGNEAHIGPNVNVDYAGTYALDLVESNRTQVWQCEIKGGGMGTNEGCVRIGSGVNDFQMSDCIIHDELSNSIPHFIYFDQCNGVQLDNIKFKFRDSMGKPFVYNGRVTDLQMSNITIKPYDSGTDAMGNLRFDAGSGTAHVNARSFESGAVLELGNAKDFDFYGYLPSSLGWSLGTRTTVNGYGENSGDPRSTGGWNGNGARAAGKLIHDNPNGTWYFYNDNDFRWEHFDPLGPTDLGSVTGSYEGEPALSDGTTAANARALYHWDATNNQWVRADGGATV